jgi:hypothetical protein
MTAAIISECSCDLCDLNVDCFHEDEMKLLKLISKLPPNNIKRQFKCVELAKSRHQYRMSLSHLSKDDRDRLVKCARHQQGWCVLCDNYSTKLSRSHIFSHGLYRIISAGLPDVKFSFDFSPPEHNARDLVFQLLCPDCEHLLNIHGENQFLEVLNEIAMNPYNLEDVMLKISDREKRANSKTKRYAFYHFAVSIIWRSLLVFYPNIIEEDLKFSQLWVTLLNYLKTYLLSIDEYENEVPDVMIFSFIRAIDDNILLRNSSLNDIVNILTAYSDYLKQHEGKSNDTRFIVPAYNQMMAIPGVMLSTPGTIPFCIAHFHDFHFVMIPMSMEDLRNLHRQKGSGHPLFPFGLQEDDLLRPASLLSNSYHKRKHVDSSLTILHQKFNARMVRNQMFQLTSVVKCMLHVIELHKSHLLSGCMKFEGIQFRFEGEDELIQKFFNPAELHKNVPYLLWTQLCDVYHLYTFAKKYFRDDLHLLVESYLQKNHGQVQVG